MSGVTNVRSYECQELGMSGVYECQELRMSGVMNVRSYECQEL